MSFIKSFHAELNQHCEKAETFLSKGAAVPLIGPCFAIMRLAFAKVQAIAAIAFIALGIITTVFGSLTGLMNKDILQNCKDLTAMGFEYLGHAIVNDLTAVREFVLGFTLIGNIAWMCIGHSILGGRTFEPFYHYNRIAVVERL